MDEQPHIEEEPMLALDMTTLAKAIQDLNKKLDEQALIIQELVLKTSSL